MYPKRVKQFYIGFTSIFKKITKEDLELVKSHLNEVEYSLFNKYYEYDKKHVLRVAKDIEKICTDEGINNSKKSLLVKTALLHDMGKTKAKINILDRVILVLLSKGLGDKAKSLKNKKVQVYYNHGFMGYEILKDYIEDDEILFLVKNHHINDIESLQCNNDDYIKDLNLLMKCDEEN
ncbi:HDIG domain-containing protein [Clostridium collagenovorans DSM 3089]|uniref:HDIG domain-containing protein n=1 Tax=Clostridium collagenovorans DSM 3089 TaxID=1121306 RepID=A0A1M5YK86_9CLOT|nr:HD domain-containing protein [Clostridium collagenovorans]SHI12436.1 HDIG domain-containing protein [Clostridium collagenovorans DSM 3089]